MSEPEKLGDVLHRSPLVAHALRRASGEITLSPDQLARFMRQWDEMMKAKGRGEFDGEE